MAKPMEPGTVLGGRFRLAGLLGGGGMGSVYRAFDLDQSYNVAVKVLNPRLARDEEFRERFVSESKLASRIPHPHILTVYDHGEDSGSFFIAMRLIETDLASMLDAQERLDPRRALNIIDQVGWALDSAHEQQLVHRDVKPENVLVTPRPATDAPDHAYLCDFGIAKLNSAESGLTQVGTFIGTVNYASPEQVRMEPLDGRSDQYSLACVLFECLSGTVPFEGGTSTVMKAHRVAEPPRLSASIPDMPAGVDDVIARAMAKHPEARFGSCREFVAAARAEVRKSLPVPEPERAAAPGATVIGAAAGAAAAPSAPSPAAQAAAAAPPPAPAPAQPSPVARPPHTGAPPGSRPAPTPASAARGSWLARHPLAAALIALFVVINLAALGAAAGGLFSEESTSVVSTTETTTPAPSSPAIPAPSSGGGDAEAAVRSTVEAYAAAEGEQQACATLTEPAKNGCETNYETAQPAQYRIDSVTVADDTATVAAAEARYDDPIKMELTQVGSTWLVSDVSSYGWKAAEERKAAGTVQDYAKATGESACDYVSEKLIESYAGASGCPDELSSEEPKQWDVTTVYTFEIDDTGSVTIEDGAGESSTFELVKDRGEYKIDKIS
ncbi:MAG: serine/threonine-protein kinase [Thermoleophilaceae bacterium]|jgi:hypothetical protein